MTRTVDRDSPMPCMVQIEGSRGGGALIPGVAYRVVEVREHWEPTGVMGEPPHVTTIVRFDPTAALPEPGLDVERLARALFEAKRPGDWPTWTDYIGAFGSPGVAPWRRSAERLVVEYDRLGEEGTE